MNSNFRLLAILVVVALLDQLTKFFAESYIQVGEVIEVIPGLFNLILTYNPGAAFGLMRDLPDEIRPYALAVSTAVALLAVGYFFLKEYRNDLAAKYCLMAILGGAVGNIIDRFRYGKVVDFLDFYIGANHWPAFNLADSVICVGVIALIFRRSKPSE